MRISDWSAAGCSSDLGTVAWRVDAFDFLAGDAPATANPSLWRQSQLTAIHGLFEVVPGIYQLRGYDLSVMTLIAGKSGWIVIDPLLSPAPAKASLALEIGRAACREGVCQDG